MACFIVPAAEAVVSTIATKIIQKKEITKDENGTLRLSDKLHWLNAMLWGGSGLLMFEHVWHGEVTPFFPFLTNAANPADAAEMFHEMATNGVGMAVLVTAVWAVMAAVTSKIEKRKALPLSPAEEVQS